MDSRSKKSRSLAVDTKVSAPKRPELGDRHNSAPSTNRSRDSQSKRTSGTTTTKTPETGRRSSKATTKDEPRSRTISQRSSDRPKSGNALVDRRSAQSAEAGEILTLTFAVLGNPGVGKTAFTNSALEQQKSNGTPFSSSKVSLGGSLYRIQLVEITFDDADFNSSRHVIWPKYLNNVAFPNIYGAFCLYDVTDEDSVAQIPQALAALTNTELPSVLIASKTDVAERYRQVSSRFHDQIRRCFANVAIFETAKNEPESHKRCLLNMLNQHLNVLKDLKPDSRRQSATDVRPKTAQHNPASSRDTSPEKSHSRSRSRSRSQTRLRISKSKDLLPAISSRPPPIDESGDEDTEDTEDGIEMPAPLKSKLRVDTGSTNRTQGRPADPQTPVSSQEHLATSQLISPSEPSKSAIPETPESYYVKSMLRPNSSDTADSRAFQTFLNMEEESHDDSLHEVPASAQALQKLTVEQTSSKESGISFQDLVERLLCLPSSKQDSKFVPSFLCLYRMFATPKQLLVAIMDQFMKTEKSNMVRFTKVAEMLRYLQVLGEWTARHPGDFAHPSVRDIATAFVQSIEKSREFGAAAKELKNNLDTYVVDDDSDWAYDDTPHSASSRDSSGTKQKTPGSSETSIPSSMTDSGLKMTPSRSFPETSGEDEGARNASSILRTGNSSQSYLHMFQLETARQEARKLRPDPQLRLSKIQWHQFMEIPVELLAREITRIDWTTYSAIRPRDYVRHVTMPENKRASRRGDNISVMVRQFNHLALFVSGMILLRDKPKHRARALEKFMALAWKVRQLNNYNSLGAIVAGINGHEITRLGQTRELIPQEVQKQFLRLTILMGHSRSHAAYRMGWENSFAERIPFLPLLRQDLTMAATANSTFISSNINWKKFEIMGEAIVGVQGSLEHPYSFGPRTSTGDHIISLILQAKILEEAEDSADPRGELYDRSVQIEPQPGADAKKKFDWLRR